MQSADWRPRLESLLADFRRHQDEAVDSGGKPDRIEAARAWHAELVDHQLAAPGWPRTVGGLELSLQDQLDYYRMTTDAGVPPHPQGPRAVATVTMIRPLRRPPSRRGMQTVNYLSV